MNIIGREFIITISDKERIELIEAITCYDNIKPCLFEFEKLLQSMNIL